MNYSSSYAHLQPAELSGNVEDLTSAAERRTVAIVLVIAVTGFIFSGSKTGRHLLTFVYHMVDHFFGGAAHKVSLPGPIGLPLVGILYQVCYN